MPDHIPLTLAGHTADVTAYDWTRLPDGHLIIVTGSDDGTVRTWDVSSISPTPGQLDEQVPTALEMIFSAQTADGTALGLTVSVHGESTLWDLRTGRLLKALRERQFSPCAVCIARTAQDRPVAVSFDTDATARIWALPEGLEITQFPTDPIGLPSSVGWQRLPDGTSVAITTGHGRKAVIWDLATGRMRAVLVGHRGQSSCVTCAQDSSGRPLALTGGHDNRVNVWNLRTGRRRNCFRIVPLRIFIARPSAGRAAAVRVLPLRDGQVFVLVATADGQLRLFKPRGFGRGARRLAAIDATAALVVGNLTNGRGIVVSVRADGVVQVWSADNFAGERAGMVPLCEIDVEITVNDISAVGDDTFVLATPNGLTAVRLYPQTLKSDWEG
jgi:WD40 repeat protein